jgi:hypothetical protein
MRIAPINQAEAIIAPLFDSNLADLKSYTVEARDGLPIEFCQSWDSCVLKGRSRNFILRWTGRFEFQHYDQLRLFLNYPEAFKLSAGAILNGREVCLFENIPGYRLPSEPTSAIFGPDKAYYVMTRLDFHFQAQPAQETHISFNWIGLVSSVREPDYERQLPRYSPDWPGLLNPNGKAALVEPLFSKREFLESLPERARQNRFAPLMRSLRNTAARFETYSPEPDIREYFPCDEHLFRYVRVRDRNRPRWDHPQRIQVLALAGYLDNHPAWSRLSARHVLALSHTPYWFEGPQGHCPGSDWHHVCFMEAHGMEALCYALPFLGDWLTPAGRAQVLDRIEEAWGLVNAKCEEPGYRWYMNQGVVNNSLRLLGALLLYQAGRGAQYADAVEQSFRDHTKIVNNYLAEEGHCSEGGYYTYSFSTSLPMWLAYAAFAGKPLAAVVPDRFKRSVAFVEATTSTLSPLGVMMSTGSNGVCHPWSSMLLAFLHRACDWPEAAHWLRNRSDQDVPQVDSNEVLVLLEMMPEELPNRPVRTGIQGCLKSGLLAYSFPFPRQGKLLLQAERPATGHHHFDRGGIILEDAGEMLLPDLGNTNYADLRCAFMSHVDWHNLAHPLDLEMRLTELPNADPPVPRARIERAEETAEGFAFALDVGPIYGPEVKVGRREGILRLPERGGRLDLRDVWQFANAHPVEIVFNSYAPWTFEGDDRAWTQVGNIRLQVQIREAGGIPLKGTLLDDRIDARLQQVWSLGWRSPAEMAVDFRSTVSWECALT